MSERFTVESEPYRIAKTFQLTEIPQLDAEKLDTVERAAVERVIADRQESLVRLQSDVLDVRSERDAFEHQLSKVTDERERLRDRVRELEAERPALEPKAVFSNLGAALEAADDDLSSERYRVDDVDFTLKANVTQTEEGVRMHLPSLDESSVSSNLSEVSFRLRAPRAEPDRPETQYVDVPDLHGLSREAAVRRLGEADLTVGTLERVSDPTTTPGAVVEQFPDAYAVADPGAPVDLVLAAEPGAESEATGESGEAGHSGETAGSTDSTDSDASTRSHDADRADGAEDADPTGDAGGDADGQHADDEEPMNRSDYDERTAMEAFRKAIIEVDPENGAAVADRLRRAGVTDLESLVELDPEAIAAELSVPVDRIVALQKRLGGHREPIALEAVSGIGPTYASRLRERGVHNVSQLAALDPETVAEITRSSASRAEGWIEEATRMAADR